MYAHSVIKTHNGWRFVFGTRIEIEIIYYRDEF